MITYKIYEIPTFIQPDGSIGKAGCTSKTIKQRAKEQGYSDVYLLEEHTDIYQASNRELEIQAEKEYTVDRIPYYESVARSLKANLKVKGKQQTQEHILKRTSVQIGVNKPNKTNECKTKISLKLKGIPKPKVTCPHCNKEGGKPAMIRYHFDKCKLA